MCRIERDPHWHPLHDLDPVTGRVLRGQQGKGGTGTGAHAGDGAVVDDFIAIEVGHELGRLAHAHCAQLGFLDVRIDPQLFQWHDGHHRCARIETLPDLGVALGDLTADWRKQGCARLRQHRFVDTGAGAQHIRMLRNRGAIGQGAGGGELFLRHIDARLCRRERDLGMLDFFI